jgi:lyso-ornithine lipid O-acyltransferase
MDITSIFPLETIRKIGVMLNYVRAGGRLIVLGVTMVLGMIYIILYTVVRGNNLERNMRIRRTWIRFIAPILGLEIINHTAAPQGVFLYISNHRSFIDPVVILHYIYAFPLAKAEVGSYPLVGFGARITGVLYVIRESMNSRVDARRAIARTLMDGWSVLVYPEGTTQNTPVSGLFKKGSFEIASVINIPVVPVAIEYKDPSDHWKDRSLLGQYLHQFGKKQSVCRIEFGDPLQSEDPEELLTRSRDWIDHQLMAFRTAFDRK